MLFFIDSSEITKWTSDLVDTTFSPFSIHLEKEIYKKNLSIISPDIIERIIGDGDAQYFIQIQIVKAPKALNLNGN